MREREGGGREGGKRAREGGREGSEMSMKGREGGKLSMMTASLP